MRPTVYLETTIVSYLVARPSRNPVVLGLQQINEEWWSQHRHRYDLRVSEAVVDEIMAGDPEAARRRLDRLHGVPRLVMTDEVTQLAGRLVLATSMPPRAAADALHIAAATVHGVDYLLTWNMRHIANAQLRIQVDAACRVFGYRAPVLCTPGELMGESGRVP